MPFFLAGCAASCGALLVLAGASKLYRAARRMTGYTAVWRALRIPRRLVRAAELAAGALEFITGIAACARVYVRADGIAMALLGAAFCALLGYARARRLPGGCGCLRWRREPARVTWRAMARGGLVCAAGVAAALAPGGGPGAFGHASCYAGALTGGALLLLLSVRAPACRRRLWRPARASLRALTGHEAFAAMGPFGPGVRHRRTGCTDEFRFPAGVGDVVFRVSYDAPGGALAVHASVDSRREKP
jgi:hypothetical protein